MFPGFDVSDWDDNIVWLWRWSNLRTIDVYLSHIAGSKSTSWTRRWHDLKDQGWGLVPIWLPFAWNHVADMAAADGNDHGRTAVSRARQAQVEHGAAIYLDIEAPVLTGDVTSTRGFVQYITNWLRTVADAGYTPGVYCSRLDTKRMLGAEFRSLAPALFPFSIPGNTRAKWDEATWTLTPATADTWPLGNDQAWGLDARTIGCQFDWFNSDRDRKSFPWPTADGRASSSRRSIDFDMSKVPDPSHPWAPSVVAISGDRDNPATIDVFTIQPAGISHDQRTPDGRRVPGQDLVFGAADIGPKPAKEVDGFDSAFAAAVSRRTGCVDLFLLGQDGYVRTLWSNASEVFPKHTWPLNPSTLARRGSPIAAVSRELDQLDVFYFDNDHRLTTQWWNPAATDWSKNVRTLDGPLAAGGTNLVALARAGDASNPSRLDVLYTGLDYSRNSSNHKWSDGFTVVHATWSATADWQVAAIAGITRPAAASGIAATRDAGGTIHAVVQRRDRSALQHAMLAPGSANWTVAAGPGALDADVDRATWWMTLQLVALPGFIALVGVTSAGTLAWSTYQSRWSKPATGSATFASNRFLALAPRADGTLDVLGIDEAGKPLQRTLTFSRTGVGTLQAQ